MNQSSPMDPETKSEDSVFWPRMKIYISLSSLSLLLFFWHISFNLLYQPTETFLSNIYPCMWDLCEESPYNRLDHWSGAILTKQLFIISYHVYIIYSFRGNISLDSVWISSLPLFEYSAGRCLNIRLYIIWIRLAVFLISGLIFFSHFSTYI